MHITLLHRPRVYFPPSIDYIQVDAQARSPFDYHVPWVVTDIIHAPNRPSPQLQIGSNIKMLDSERFQMNGRAIACKGSLQAVLSVEKGYIIYALHPHERGHTDIYGAQYSAFRVAIPHHLTHLTMATAIYYCINFSRLDESIGQTMTQKVVHPPHRSFAGSRYYQRTREQRQQALEETKVGIEG